MPLVLKRRKEQWVEIVHRSGDMIRIQVSRLFLDDDPHGDAPSASLRFVDEPRNFEIYRPDHWKSSARCARPAKEDK